jgi:hypothetical protein
MINSGRYGEVLYDPAGGTATVKIIALNNWKLSNKTDRVEVTCFGDTNKVYVPGLKDISGTVGGFWDSADPTLFEAADAATPGKLKLVPNNTEATFYWQGLAYMDADIEVPVDGAPGVTGTFSAAGPWTFTNTLAATAGGHFALDGLSEEEQAAARTFLEQRRRAA